MGEKLLSVGYATIDQIEGRRYKGGAAAGIAINGKHLGYDTSLLAMFGTDRQSNTYLKYLAQIGVNLGLAKKYENARLPINTLDHANRALGWNGRGIEELMPNVNVNSGDLTKFNIIHLASAHPLLVKKTLDARPRKGEIISFSPGPKSINNPSYFDLQVLRATDILFLSEAEYLAFMKHFSLEKADSILLLGPKTIVITLGEKGSMVISKNKGKVSTEGIRPITIDRVVDTTGAGDAYALGFLIGVINHLTPKSCGELGAELASFAINRKGVIINNNALRKFNQGKLLIST